jgi:hypothetical protein
VRDNGWCIAARFVCSTVNGSRSAASIAEAEERSVDGSFSTFGTTASNALSQRSSASSVRSGLENRTAFHKWHNATSASSLERGGWPAETGSAEELITAASRKASTRMGTPSSDLTARLLGWQAYAFTASTWIRHPTPSWYLRRPETSKRSAIYDSALLAPSAVVAR